MKKSLSSLACLCVFVSCAMAQSESVPEASAPSPQLSSLNACTLTLQSGVFLVRVPQLFVVDVCAPPGGKIKYMETLAESAVYSG